MILLLFLKSTRIKEKQTNFKVTVEQSSHLSVNIYDACYLIRIRILLLEPVSHMLSYV